MSLAVVVEGDTDLPVVRKLALDAGLEISVEIDCGGKARLDEDLPGYNDAAQGWPWFVLRDLDHDAPCAGDFVRALRFSPSRWMCFRIAVRELEAWLLADVEGLAGFLEVQEAWIPLEPDSEADPTAVLVNLARRSRRSSIRRAMVPAAQTSAVVGPLYEAKIIEFGERYWDLARACRRSESLRRARRAVRELSSNWRKYIQATE